MIHFFQRQPKHHPVVPGPGICLAREEIAFSPQNQILLTGNETTGTKWLKLKMFNPRICLFVELSAHLLQFTADQIFLKDKQRIH